MSEKKWTVEKIKEYTDACLEETDIDLKPRGQKLKLLKMADFLLSQLATIERDTAKKCYNIAMKEEYPPAAIRRHFNLGEKP